MGRAPCGVMDPQPRSTHSRMPSCWQGIVAVEVAPHGDRDGLSRTNEARLGMGRAPSGVMLQPCSTHSRIPPCWQGLVALKVLPCGDRDGPSRANEAREGGHQCEIHCARSRTKRHARRTADGSSMHETPVIELQVDIVYPDLQMYKHMGTNQG